MPQIHGKGKKIKVWILIFGFHVWIALKDKFSCSTACFSINLRRKRIPKHLNQPQVSPLPSSPSQPVPTAAPAQRCCHLLPWKGAGWGKQTHIRATSQLGEPRQYLSLLSLAWSPVSLTAHLDGFGCENCPYKGTSHRFQPQEPYSQSFRKLGWNGQKKGLSKDWMGQEVPTAWKSICVFQRLAEQRPTHGYFGKNRKV